MDFYDTLGVPKSASVEQIKKAYRQKARAHHPDMHSGDEAKAKNAEIFKAINQAFEVLGDPEKKARYDVQGYWGRRPPSQPTPRPKADKPTPKTKEEFEREKKEEARKDALKAGRYDHEPMNVTCTFYGGEGSGRSILVHVKLSPSEMKNGCSKTVMVKKRDFCNRCGGDAIGLFPCPKCRNHSIAKMSCGYCDTTGEREGKCDYCRGTGVGKWMVEELGFKVSPNTQPGHSVTLLGMGETAPRKPPGNVRIVLL